MLISSTRSARPLHGDTRQVKSTAHPTNPTDSFVHSAGRKALQVLKKTARSSSKYFKPALIAAAPAIATAVAASLGGIPATALAIVGSGLVGSVAGIAAWSSDIGLVRGFAGGGLAGMSLATLGAVGGGFGVINAAAIGATREAILRHLA